MEGSLFSKYKKEIDKQKNKKLNIITLVQETTNILLQEEEIEIGKNHILLHVSSTKRSVLYKKQIQTILKEKGYTLK